MIDILYSVPEPSTAAGISCAYASSHRMSNNRARICLQLSMTRRHKQKHQDKKEQLDGHPTALAMGKATGVMHHLFAKQC
jgi:hypothetical protein